MGTANLAASQHPVFSIKYGELPRNHGSNRSEKFDAGSPSAERVCDGRVRLPTVTDRALALERQFAVGGEGDIGEVGATAQKLLPLSQLDRRRRGIDRRYVGPLPNCDSEISSLPYRVSVNSRMFAHDLSFLVQDIAWANPFRGFTLDEFIVPPRRDETELLTLPLASPGETEALRLRSDFLFRRIPQGQTQTTKGPFRKHMQEVALVLAAITTAIQPRLPSNFDDSRVVTGRDRFCVQSISKARQFSHFDRSVAVHARTGSLSAKVGVDEGGNDVLTKCFSPIECIVRNPQ